MSTDPLSQLYKGKCHGQVSLNKHTHLNSISGYTLNWMQNTTIKFLVLTFSRPFPV
jgi:hypothetical protein